MVIPEMNKREFLKLGKAAYSALNISVSGFPT